MNQLKNQDTANQRIGNALLILTDNDVAEIVLALANKARSGDVSAAMAIIELLRIAKS
jgi:hypothetical protein